MGKLLPISPRFNQQVVKTLKNQSVLDRALKKSKESTGIDFYKVITGDQQETQRYLMKQRQADLQEG